MSAELKIIEQEESTLTLEECQEVDANINFLIEMHKENRQEINRLTFESVAAMTAGEDYERELSSKTGLRRFIGGITGNNKKLQDKINSSHIAVQYAAQQTLQRLAEENVITFDMIASVNKKLNDSTIVLGSRVNKVGKALLLFFEQYQGDLLQMDARITNIEQDRHLERHIGSLCDKCRASLPEGQVVCPNCGTVQTLKLKGMPDTVQKKLNTLAEIIRSDFTDPEIAWNLEAQRLAAVLKKACALTGNDAPLGRNLPANLQADIDVLMRWCKNAEFQIALVGALKAGKSMLMNALIGVDLASTGVNSETAAVTKFRSATNNYVKVTFYTQEQWDKLKESAQGIDKNSPDSLWSGIEKVEQNGTKEQWIGKAPLLIPCADMGELKRTIQQWTSATHDEHLLAAEVEVGIERSLFDMPKEVVFVDTPGLHDPVAYRSQITEQYIQNANAVLIVVKADPFQTELFNTISKILDAVGTRNEKAYIVATHIDTRNKLDEYDIIINGKDGWVNSLTKARRYKDEENTRQHICGTSAYLQICLNNFIANVEISDDQYTDLEAYGKKRFGRTFYLEDLKDKPQLVAELRDSFGIDTLRSRLDRTLIQEYQKLMMRDIQDGYSKCKKQLLNLANEVKQKQQDDISAVKAGAEEARTKQMIKNVELKELKAQQTDVKKKMDELRDRTIQRLETVSTKKT